MTADNWVPRRPKTVPDDKQAAQRALVDSILSGDGRASADQRAQAFNGGGPLRNLVENVIATPVQVTDGDFAAAKAAGFTDDQLFELVVCAAVGHSTRLYEAGLAALEEAI
ncbi:hypothetical protein AB0L70_03600 [Kribbella sp. NPDC051952]|uniref:hypothetical protein n=1 Tax=Kribbella sp. NPDC051952 TaxID=3154851 RepID=UPI00342A87BD